MAEPAEPRRLLFSAQKNEGPFILEWVAYHKAVGFTDIVVVSNDCDDGSDRLLDELSLVGALTHIRQTVPEGAAPQKNAERVAREAGVFRDGDWVMWLDLDEFFLPNPEFGSVQGVIDAVPSAAAIGFAWRFFGDSGNETWPGRHVGPRFTRAAHRRRGARTQFKTLFRYGPMIERLDIHRPILTPGTDHARFPAITSARSRMPPEFYDTSRRTPYNRMTGEKGAYRLGQIAHFSVRTPDLFAEKARRGDGYYANPEDVVRDDRFYHAKNFNGVEERGLLKYQKEVDSGIAALLSSPGVREACERIPMFRTEPPGPAEPAEQVGRSA